MPAHDSEYTPLAQDDVEKVPDSPSWGVVRDYRPASSLSIWTIILVTLVVAINIACMATTWSRVEKVYAGLHEMLDFRDTRDLWRPNTNSYYGE
ncbi:hypothetical protein PsYK624_138040 [Phanerochaete sordida]|uniref:Uncharacterized protein n=1 Tax=Phanerochaete sordida TaxID=48140 RepID=A0A9P3GMB9_9APHY|nr:hypothetical protein PsYK624_138040 [Phanerochaete sordida]